MAGDWASASWDYVIVGAGSAGCVLADRLSRDPKNRVLLLEAGGPDRHPFIHIPKGVGKLFGDPAYFHFYQTEADDHTPSETWVRGKLVGGSSSINGMMYFRGQPQDYEAWAKAAGAHWRWSEMARAFAAVEDHEQAGRPGATPGLGSGGPLHVSLSPDRTPLAEALIQAGVELGLPRRTDVTQSDREGVAYGTRTLKRGRRQSAAQAFLHPALRRPNLHLATGVTVDRVEFAAAGRAVGVSWSQAGRSGVVKARGEVILAAGALASPGILQRSGIGPAAHLQNLGIPVVHDSPDVGRRLLEHRLLMLEYSLKRPLSQNEDFRGARLYWSALRYLLTRTGPLAAGSYDVAAFARTDPDDPLPDVEILIAPYSLGLATNGMAVGAGHGLHLFGYPLRSRSEGSVMISGVDPAAPMTIRPNYLSDPYDQAVTVRMFRYVRNWMRQPAMADIVGEETAPGPALERDEDIVAAFRGRGQVGLHACGSCRMGRDGAAVLDGELRVRGVSGLRVVDASIMPTMVSCNTNGPVIALAWRAADLILSKAQ